MIHVKRVYEKAEKSDGTRFLVERLWPRGVKKDALRMDAWLKDVAPSTELRTWFCHDPELWDEFRVRYAEELQHQATLVDDLRKRAKQGTVTLLYGARDEERNQAVVLADYLASP